MVPGVLFGWSLAVGAMSCQAGGAAEPPVDAPAAVDAAVDAPVDAAIDGPSAGPVTVRVVRPFTPEPAVPLAGVRVFASAPDGSVGASGVTAADGTVTVPVVPGGAVTAVLAPNNSSRTLSTIFGVEPGDSLTIDPQRPPGLLTSEGITYRWPQTPDADNSLQPDAVVVDDGCWDRAATTFAPDPPLPPLPTETTLSLVAGCGTNPRDVVIAHYDSGHLARYAVLRGVPATVGIRTVPAWSLPDTTFTAHAINLPAHVVSFRAAPSPIVHGHAFDRRGRAPGGVGTATVETPWASELTAARVVYELQSNTYGAMYCYDDAPTGALSVTFDAATAVAMIGAGRLDPIDRTVRWPRDTGPDPDEARVTLTYFGAGLGPRVEWSLRAAGTVDHLRLPTLPSDLVNLDVRPGRTVVYMDAYDLETVRDWATMRALPFWTPVIDAVASSRWGRLCQVRR